MPLPEQIVNRGSGTRWLVSKRKVSLNTNALIRILLHQKNAEIAALIATNRDMTPES
jgi:hypothetical protein